MNPGLYKNMKAIDAENLVWLKKTVEEHGFPTASMVSDDGANAAWMLVQHADQDPEFQKKCLELLLALPEDDVSNKDIAYLTDRVLQAQGKPGRYGTQLAMKNGKFVVGDVEDPENLDKRRKEAGLGTMASYIREAEIGYGIRKPTFDHHVHVISPTLIAHWKSVGMRFSRSDIEYGDPDEVMKIVGTDRAIAVSMAHLYGSEWLSELETVRKHEADAVREENDFVANCVKKSRGRMCGFFSANPLGDYAMKEYERCLKVKQLVGLKLHFPANAIDINNDEHVTKLKKVFRWCVTNNVPILVHPAGVEESAFGLAGARRFWTELVEPHPNLKMIVAHIGASGGFGPNSAAILNGFQELRERNEKFMNAEIYFDMSGSILVSEVEGIAPTSISQCAALAASMRRIGLNHFVPASDYPALSPREIKDALLSKLPLERGELEKLLSNSAPFVREFFK